MIPRAAGALLFIATALLFLAATGIVVPAPARVLLPLSVGAPELSAWLLVMTSLTAVLCLNTAMPVGCSRVALGLSLCTGALALLPLVQIPGASRRIEEGLRSAFGADYLDGVDQRLRAGLRPDPVRLRELFIGIDHGPDPHPNDVVYASPGGVRLTTRIYQPAARGGPVIVQFYGGAWQRGSPADNPALATYLAGRGYVVFAMDYRHAPLWHWPAQMEDVRTSLTWVRDHAREYGGDASRIAIVGRSAGAHLALMGAYTAAEPGVRSVVGLYGPTDLARGYRELPRPDPIGVRATLEALMGGGPDALPEQYAGASPVTYAAGRQPPTLQIVGSRDHVVLPRFARSLDERLRAAGNRSVLIELPWADHAFDAVPFGPGAQLTLYAVERFLARTVGAAAGSRVVTLPGPDGR